MLPVPVYRRQLSPPVGQKKMDMAENKVRFNLFTQVWFTLKVALLPRRIEFPVGERVVASNLSVAVKIKAKSTESGNCEPSAPRLHPLVKFNSRGSVLKGTIHEEGGLRVFRGYFRTNLYFLLFTLWPLPIYFVWSIFTVAGIITFREDPSTFVLCVFGLIVIVPVVNFLRYMAEDIIDQENAFVETHHQ